MLCEQLAASLAGILRTSIRVMDTAPWRLPGSNCGLQCFNCQTCVDRRISDPPGATRRRECYRGAFLTPSSGGPNSGACLGTSFLQPTRNEQSIDNNAV